MKDLIIFNNTLIFSDKSVLYYCKSFLGLISSICRVFDFLFHVSSLLKVCLINHSSSRKIFFHRHPFPFQVEGARTGERQPHGANEPVPETC
jgi:hypothetical protein